MNRPVRLLLAFLLLTLPAAEAAKRRLSVDTETAEGVLLKQLVDETDAAKKTALMEDFAAKHPKHESATWVLGELQTAYLKANDFSKAMAVTETVIAADPDDVAIAQGGLKAAEGAKDPALISKWAVTASTVARRVVASTKPAAEEEATAWKTDVEFAKQVDAYCDYALYALAAQATAPAQRIEAAELLIKRSPASEYNKQIRPQLFIAYQQAGNHARAVAIAEEDIRNGSTSDDMLIYAASKAYERQDKAKATQYAKQLLEVLPPKPAPQGVSEADWAKNKSLKLGLAQWMLGVLASNDKRWAEADSYLRAALPNFKDNKDITAETLFHLGLANYNIAETKKDKNRILEALKFNNQCAAIASNFQAQAKKNVAAIRSQYHITQ